jgi:hypothetical protein
MGRVLPQARPRFPLALNRHGRASRHKWRGLSRPSRLGGKGSAKLSEIAEPKPGNDELGCATSNGKCSSPDFGGAAMSDDADHFPLGLSNSQSNHSGPNMCVPAPFGTKGAVFAGLVL